MRAKPFYSQYTALTIEDALTRILKKPFIIVDDAENKCKRLFLTQEDADKWFHARSEGTMTDDIMALEFAGNTIPGDEQFELRVNITNPVAYALKGSTGNCVFFNFATVDKASQQATGEAVDVYFTISNGDGTRQKPKVYTYEEGKTYSFNLDNYLATGVNTITLMVHGRTSGLNKVVSMTYEILNFSLTTSFNIAKSLAPSDTLSVTYTCVGDYQRTVHFYIDGVEKAAETISAIEPAPTKVKSFPLFGNEYGVGSHSIQLKASMNLNETVFWSDLLYREFEVTGQDHTTTLVSNDFPSTQDPFNGSLPGFTAKQYEVKKLDWAYYSSRYPTANVTWRLFAPDGTETTIGSRQADVVEGETDVMPEPVKFMPTESGVFLLQALVNGEIIKSYSISVSPNEELSEAVSGMTLRLTAVGRSNQEEEQYRKDWSSTKNGVHAYCEFSQGFPFTAAAGYNNDGVEFYNRYTGIIKGYKPMAIENASVSNNGFCFGMRFRTFNMDSEDAILARIGDPDHGAGIFVYPNRAILRSSAGPSRDVEVRFKDEEDTDLYWVVYPNHDATMQFFTFMLVNGIRCFPRIYDLAENYNVGSEKEDSDYGYLHLGDPNGLAGIRVYSIRSYVIYQSERELCNNFIIDSGDLEKEVERNDIYQLGGGMLDVDVVKLEERMPLAKFTGDLSVMEGGEGKPELTNIGFEFTHPDYYDHYIQCDLLHIKKTGQSTQDRLGPPSIRCSFNKNKSNVAKDRNGKQYPKNRIPILPGYTPENKWRMLNNTLDSSCCNTGGALSFINKIAQDTQIDGKHPLRTPYLDYVLSGKYSEAMAAKHGGTAADYPFPYKLAFTPTAFAGAALWRKDAESPWQWLGMYTFIEEKKSFYANGGHSIYDTLTDGTPDPFNIRNVKKLEKGSVLVDNSGYLRFELVTKGPYSMLQKGGENTYDSNRTEREAEIEKISEHDDETDEQTLQDWAIYGNEVVKPLCATEGNLSAFDAKIWTIFDIYSVCAYYLWMIVVCNTDGSLRNINQCKYQTGGLWHLVPWDWDMILGLLQDTYRLDAPPCADLYTKVDNTYIYNGMGDRIEGATGQDSYWFWDACLKNAEFKAMLPRVFAAMYSAGMTKKNWIEAFDKFTTSFSPALYNVDALGKYVNPYFNYGKNYLVSDQGDRTAHRHWFIDTNVDYFEQMYGVGDFVNTRTSTRAADADHAKIYCTAGATAYFGWTISGIILNGETESEGGVENSSRTDRMLIGQQFSMTVDRKLTSKDILGILSPQKLERLDMHEFARFFSADLQFNSCYNDVTNTCLMKTLILGMTHEDIKSYGVNERAVNTIDGVAQMQRLETFSIRGLKGLKSNPLLTGCNNLHNFYAAGSGLTAFNPADGSIFTELELNDSIASFKCTDVTFPDNGPTFLTVGKDIDAIEIGCPTSLLVLNLTGMGSDKGTHALLHKWLMMLEANPELFSQALLTCKGIEWNDATKADVLALAKITMQRSVTGYIFVTDGTYTQEERSILLNAFGNNVFNYDTRLLNLVCDCNGTGISVSAAGTKVEVISETEFALPQGSSCKFSGSGFPIRGNNAENYRFRVFLNGEWRSGSNTVPIIRINDYTTLNFITGEFIVEENPNPQVTYQIQCWDIVTRNSGTVTMTVKRLTYPDTAHITLDEVKSQTIPVIVSGTYQITGGGSYFFKAENFRSDNQVYTGTMRMDDGGVWTLVGADENYVYRNTAVEENPFIEFCLEVKNEMSLDDIEMTLQYRSNWKGLKDSESIDSNVIGIAIISVIEYALVNDEAGGNPPLFRMMEAYGIDHYGPASYTSMELKSLQGEAKVPVDTKNFRSDEYIVTRFLKNVTDLDLSNCKLISQSSYDEAIELMPWLLHVNTEGTNINVIPTSIMSKLQVGSPTIIRIENCPLIKIEK